MKTREYTTLVTPLTDDELSSLSNHCPNLKTNNGKPKQPYRVLISHTKGHYEIETRGHVGVFAINANKCLIIEPKFTMLSVFALILSSGYEIQFDRSSPYYYQYSTSDESSNTDREQFISLLIEAFSSSLSMIIKRGILRGYTTTEETLEV